MFRARIIVALFFLLIGSTCLAGSLLMPFGKARSPGVGFYPLLVGMFLVALSVPFIIQSWKSRHNHLPDEEPFPRGPDLRRVAAVAIAVGLYPILLTFLGYILSSFFLLVSVLRLFGLQSRWKIVLIALITVGLSYYLFARILAVPLPRGTLFS